ncbi:histone deacetylase [Corallincola holothuriorum]|uniref:Histone deacetylase n=1 Tax=Corallincola holothuriorum TaxID=2282215 RepID=A0A368NIQ4_9GAMM|nr:histone deacetylase [Corallincola holothuriorum]RCU50467.1 histone deacetylase [Corallincola holothuriorum]
MATPHIVYSDQLDISLGGLEKLHPFDGRKFSKAWEQITSILGEKLDGFSHLVTSPVTDTSLGTFHTDFYLSLVADKRYIAQVVEIPIVRWLPSSWVMDGIVKPMRYATQATILATELALDNGFAVSLAGGFHHASKSKGEGFCAFSDIPVAVNLMTKQSLLHAESRIAIVDLDAHQGNGFERAFYEDERVRFFDMYNSDIYPRDRYAEGRIDYPVKLASKTADAEYLSQLKEHLAIFIERFGPFDLIYYNAGTDILAGDKLGQLSVSFDGILERDAFVLDICQKASKSTVMVTSGGYSADSYKLIAQSVINQFEL